MAIKFTEFRGEFAPSQVMKVGMDSIGEASLDDLANFGLSVGMDADDTVLAQTGFTPLQYLQQPLGKPVEVLTTPTVLDKITGRAITTDWDIEDVIQPAVEFVGTPRPYSDDNNAPSASVNYDFETRKVRRFELTASMGKLEDARLSRMGVLGYKSPFEYKRTSIAKAFQMLIDEIGFRGYTDGGSGVTDGLITDHNLLPAISADPQTASGTDTEWEHKDFDHITADIRMMFATLSDQTETHFDGMAGDACKLVLAPKQKNALTRTNALGKTVLEWLKENYEGCEVIAAPRFRNAFDEGVDGAMLIADSLNGEEVTKNIIPTLMRLEGIEKHMKRVDEGYFCATAGVIVKQPVGVVTMTGI